MNTPEQYEADVLFFFNGRPDRLALYHALLRQMEAAFPAASIQVRQSQISFYGRRLFAMVSLPRRKSLPGIVVSFGLERRLNHPRVLQAVEPYPNRWTHHVPVSRKEELDETLLGWLEEAWAFAQTKG